MGCGWLGWPLAEKLLADGYIVRGTTTNPDKIRELEASGIRAFQIQLTETGFEGDWQPFFKGLDCLIFNIPPGIRANPDTDYPAKIRHLLRVLTANGSPRLIYIGSTSVYGRSQGTVDESAAPEPDTESGRQLLAAEKLLENSPLWQSTQVIRFGGLIGPDRHPVTMLSGRTGLTGGRDPVNLIHLEDCVELIRLALTDADQVGIFNAVAPGHPTKESYYREEARKRGLEPPGYQQTANENTGKCITSSRILVKMYDFKTTP